MSKLLKYIGFLFGLSLVFAGLYHVWDYRQHYVDFKGKEVQFSDRNDYEVQLVPKGSYSDIEPPKLPDISQYTLQSVKDKMPEPKEGKVLIQDLEEGYRKLRGELDKFSEMQERILPLAIVDTEYDRLEGRISFLGNLQGRVDPLAIVVEEGVYTLEMLFKDVSNPSLFAKTGPKQYTLYVPLSIRRGATLLIKNEDKLLMSESTGGLITTFGDVFIVESSVVGWNTEEDKPGYYTDKRTKFRPYLTAWCGSNLHMAGSTIAHLGYQTTKSYGITYTSCTDTIYRRNYEGLPGGTGHIIDNYYYDVYFGFYSYEANDVVILRNIYDQNIVYGIDPHDRSKGLIIAYNEARGIKEKHGIIVSREVNHSYIFNNISEDNYGSGFMIDRTSHDNVIAYNISRNNQADGLTFFESANNLSYKNVLINNGKAGMRIRNSWNITSYGDVINNNGGMGVKLYATYLDPNHQAKYRDLELDPYTERAGLTLIRPEMVGNKKADFKLSDIDELTIVRPKFFKSPTKTFSGDLIGYDEKFLPSYNENYEGVHIKALEE